QGTISKNSFSCLLNIVTCDRGVGRRTPFKEEVVSLPFSSESQGTISKNSFSCLLNIVTCDRGVGRRTPFSGEVVKKLLCIKQ
ncbi:hypothetical protein, partial [Enterococcus faecium]|uniref:hypothetical protein n=1 Tax=Enterococcus faecium TaxID=1352 RepID=UPI001C4F7830